MITLKKGDKVVELLTKLEEVDLSKLSCNFEPNGDDTVLVAVINRLSVDDLVKLAKDANHKCMSAGSVIYGISQFTNKELVVPMWAVEQDLIRLPNTSNYLQLKTIVSELGSIVDLSNSLTATIELGKLSDSDISIRTTNMLFVEFALLSKNYIKGVSKTIHGSDKV